MGQGGQLAMASPRSSTRRHCRERPGGDAAQPGGAGSLGMRPPPARWGLSRAPSLALGPFPPHPSCQQPGAQEGRGGGLTLGEGQSESLVGKSSHHRGAVLTSCEVDPPRKTLPLLVSRCSVASHSAHDPLRPSSGCQAPTSRQPSLTAWALAFEPCSTHGLLCLASLTVPLLGGPL